MGGGSDEEATLGRRTQGWPTTNIGGYTYFRENTARFRDAPELVPVHAVLPSAACKPRPNRMISWPRCCVVRFLMSSGLTLTFCVHWVWLHYGLL